MAFHEVQSNERHLHHIHLQGHLHRAHFPLTYSSSLRPEGAMDVQRPALEVAHQVP